MTITIATKFRLGFSIALLGTISIGCTIAFLNIRWIRYHPGVCSLLVGLAGGFFLLKRHQPDTTTQEQAAEGSPVLKTTAPAHPLSFLGSLRYWGAILILSAVVLYGLNRTLVHARARVIVPKPIAIAKAPVVFPSLALQGLIFDGAKSSALINGQVLCIGEGIGNVKVVAIDHDHVEVELKGETKKLLLEESMQAVRK